MFRERQQRARDTVTKNTSPDPALPGLVGLGSLLAPLTCVRQGLPGGGGGRPLYRCRPLVPSAASWLWPAGSLTGFPKLILTRPFLFQATWPSCGDEAEPGWDHAASPPFVHARP